MQRSLSMGLALSAALVMPVLAWAQAPAPNLSDLDAYIQKEMDKEKVPGLAIAVVKDGEVIYQRGFGYRDVAQKLPVTNDTAFPIASVTKSFTVLALGSLVGEGKLDWDAPVRQYAPDFKLYDADTTAHITTRDLVSHRSGLPRHDAVWYGATLPRSEYWQRLRYLQPSADLRERFQYNNLMFVAAGYLGGERIGRDWETLVTQRVLQPTGMTGTSLAIDGLRHAQQPALGYQKKEDESVVAVPYTDIDGVAPAGAINSTLADMTRYLRLHLGQGELDGRRVIDADVFKQMRVPLIATDGEPDDPEFSQGQYGMGVAVNVYRGNLHVSHGGNIDGFTSFISYLPEQKVGVVMLSNLNGSHLRNILPYHIYDRLTGMSEIDWGGRIAAREASDKAAEVGKGKPESGAAPLPTLRKSGTRPGHALAEYAGEYTHPAYGTVTVSTSGKALELGFHGASAPLQHYHYDVFQVPQVELNPLEHTQVRFVTGFAGDIDALEIPMESTVAPIVFARVAPAAMRERSFLQALAGDYTQGSDAVNVALRQDGTLLLTRGGRSLALLPVSGTRFRIDQRYGQELEFTRNRSGAIDGFVEFQAWGDRRAVRR